MKIFKKNKEKKTSGGSFLIWVLFFPLFLIFGIFLFGLSGFKINLPSGFKEKMFEKEFETKYYKLVFMNKKNKIKFIFNTFIIILSFLNYIISFMFMLYVMIVLRDVFYASIVLLVYFLLDISLNGLGYGIFPTIKNIMIYQFHNEYLKSKYFVLYGIYNEDTKFYKEMREKLSKEVKKEMYLYNFFEEENTEVKEENTEVKEEVLKKELKYKKGPFITTNIFIKIHSNLRNLFIFLMPVLVFITYFV